MRTDLYISSGLDDSDVKGVRRGGEPAENPHRLCFPSALGSVLEEC